MKWFGREESANVDDRRSRGRTMLTLGGGAGIVVALLAWFLGVDLNQVSIPNLDGPGVPSTARADLGQERQASFTKVVFRDTELVWGDEFERLGRTYTGPTLVLYNQAVESACGSAFSAVGPFYCPDDAKVYIDLSFYEDMEKKLQAPGDFARAYVVAHEVGHHVQRLLGLVSEDDNRFSAETTNGNRESVRLELQADFLAGVWAHDAESKFHYLEPGDLETALNATYQIGDDRLQKRTKGYVVPDSFTHGTSAQRAAAFRKGFDSGDIQLARDYFEPPAPARLPSELGE